jgi:phosphonopyruvate decarboxylase
MSKLDEIQNYIHQIKGQPGPHLLEIKIKKGSRDDLGRPTSSPAENKEALMKAFR